MLYSSTYHLSIEFYREYCRVSMQIRWEFFPLSTIPIGNAIDSFGKAFCVNVKCAYTYYGRVDEESINRGLDNGRS